MERHQTHLLGIYTQANSLALAKRKLLRSLTLPPVEQSQEDQVTSSTKLILSLNKLHAELQRAMHEFSLDPEDPCLQQLASTAQGLKNDRELFTQEEAVIAELQHLRAEWEQQDDPLIRYEQGERQAIRDRLSTQLKELERWEGLARSTKKPLYVRKLERELRDNLERAASSERAFNSRQQERYLAGRARLLRVVGRLAGGMGRTSRQSLVSEAKNTLLRNYIDRFHQGNSLTDRELDAYRLDYTRTLQAITMIFKREIESFSQLQQFAGKVESAATTCYRGVLAAEDECSLEMRQVSEQIFTIVSPRDVIEVVHNCKHFFAFTREWDQIQPRLARAKLPLEEALAALKEQGARTVKEGREGRLRGGAVEGFIQDKKFMEQLVKKETQFEEALLAAWHDFLERYLRALEATPQTVGTQGSQIQSRNGKSRLETAFDRLFISYLGETEGERQGSSLRHSNRALISEFQQLIASISIFSETVDMSGSYSCSLGPKLLIHGRVKVLPEGLYYESSFNQRNYFFGRTRLFLPKEELFEVNKQTALLLFPDVLEIVTKYGPVYLHALGKRETMYQHFIDAFLPEVNHHQDEQEIKFNPFRGDLTQAEKRVMPYLKALQTEIITIRVENIDFRTYFHKYWSNTEFSYQGRTYKDFKHFMCQLAEGKNVHCSEFTPGIPDYLQPQPPTGQSLSPVDIEQSERLVTYDRKIPNIPFVSKGGDGVCHEKLLFRWGGPRLLCIDISATLSGFSMTDSMVVQSRHVFREVNGGVEMAVSAQVSFGISSPLNPMVRSPALSNLKDYFAQVADKFAKLQRNRPAGGSMKKLEGHMEGSLEQERIEQLQGEVAMLKKRMKVMGIAFAVLYFLTLLFFIL